MDLFIVTGVLGITILAITGHQVGLLADVLPCQTTVTRTIAGTSCLVVKATRNTGNFVTDMYYTVDSYWEVTDLPRV